MTLAELKIGQTATIINVGGQGSLRQHFLDMGVLPGIPVTLVKYAPMGDPMELRIHAYELTLRKADARQITVTPVDDFSPKKDIFLPLDPEPEHPGLGEGGHYHREQNEERGISPAEKPDKSRPLTFALVGNQNCGKTTLFNQLTGSNQHVGNFPGVTVDRKDGIIRG